MRYGGSQNKSIDHGDLRSMNRINQYTILTSELQLE